MNSNTGFSTKLSLLTLGGSFVFIFFSFLLAAVSYLASFFIVQNGYKDWFISQPAWYNLTTIGVTIFILMTLVIYLVDKFLFNFYLSLKGVFGKTFLMILSLVAFVSLAIGFYYGFPSFLIYLKQTFWL